MRILGFVKTSFVDYPGNIVSTLFVGGCNFRCPYCHNPELVLNKEHEIDKKKIFGYLKRRKGLIDGVCISGGEPTLYNDLPEFLQELKSLGLLIKLDTNGSNPELLQKVIEGKLVDYIAMDVKSSFDKYALASGVNADLDKIRRSVELVKNSNVDYEFRTTMVPKLIKREDFENLCHNLKGADKFCLQQFDPRNELLDNSLKNEKLYPPSEMEDFKKLAEPFFKKCELRNL